MPLKGSSWWTKSAGAKISVWDRSSLLLIQVGSMNDIIIINSQIN